MAIDIRAISTCNLGPLISASISDDYVQGTGLIKTSGNCEIAAVIHPSMGTAISFSYNTGSISKKIPKVLRVLSSFADPFRGTTSIEFGCPLKYMEDVTEPIKLDSSGDPINADLLNEDKKYIITKISAAWIAQQCLQAISISGSTPLTNQFTIDQPFDLSSGYVNVLSDLLISESYCGYIGPDGSLKTFSLSNPGGSGRVITADDLVEVGPLNFGQLPGDTVTVNYTSVRLAGAQDPNEDPPEDQPGEETPPEEQPIKPETSQEALKRAWELQEDYGQPEETKIKASYILKVNDVNITPYDFEVPFTYCVVSKTVTRYDTLDRVLQRVTVESSILAAANPEYTRQYMSWHGTGSESIGATSCVKVTVDDKFYKYAVGQAPAATEEEPTPEGEGEGVATKPENQTTRNRGYDDVLLERTSVYMSECAALSGTPGNFYGVLIEENQGGSVTLTDYFVYASTGPANFTIGPENPSSSPSYLDEPGLVLTQVTERYFETFQTELFEADQKIGYFPINKTTTTNYQLVCNLSKGKDYFNSRVEEGETMLTLKPEMLVLTKTGSSVNIVSGREAVMEGRPSTEARILNEQKKEEAKTQPGEATSAQPSDSNSSSGSKLEQQSEIELIYTNGGTGRKIEFTMPYAPDDTFQAYTVYVDGQAVRRYRAITSNAKTKAALFGRTQNALLMGNRSGINLQTTIDAMPFEPFTRLVVQASGLTGVYATNGSSWTIDSNGIIASTDALLIGVTGKA